ncbi:unnamed protein product [Rotaria sp. Silwood1]|nr:unnamed protein product [Rotaria sp. Silwood1]
MFNSTELMISIDRGLYELRTDNHTNAAALLIVFKQKSVRELFERIMYVSEHSSIAMTLENLRLVYENKENFQQTLSYYEQAAKIYRKILPQMHPDVMQIDEALRRTEI